MGKRVVARLPVVEVGGEGLFVLVAARVVVGEVCGCVGVRVGWEGEGAYFLVDAADVVLEEGCAVEVGGGVEVERGGRL